MIEEKLEIKFARMEEKIDTILEKLEKLDSSKADKWVQHVVTFLLCTSSTVLIGWAIKVLLVRGTI